METLRTNQAGTTTEIDIARRIRIIVEIEKVGIIGTIGRRGIREGIENAPEREKAVTNGEGIRNTAVKAKKGNNMVYDAENGALREAGTGVIKNTNLGIKVTKVHLNTGSEGRDATVKRAPRSRKTPTSRTADKSSE